MAELTERDRSILESFARRISPVDPGAQNNLGVLFFHRGLVDRAIQCFARALELDSKMQIAQRNLEIAYRQTGYYDRRVSELQERLRGAPDDRAARWELGRAYAALGQYDQAMREFQALARENPGDIAVLVQLGLAEKQRGNLDAATEWYERARDRDPESSVVHFYLGEALYNRGLTAAALGSLHRAIELNAENADAHYLMAFVLGEMDRQEEARAAAKRAMQLNPTLGRAQTHLTLERGAGRRSIAQRAIEPEAAEGTGDASLAHFNLGLAFRQKGYHTEALREYRLALDRGEKRPVVLQAMAEVQLLKRDYLAALDLYDSLIADLPDSSKLWNERGVVLQQLGRPADAVASYRKATDLSPGYGRALNNLAVALALAGDHDESLTLFRDAIRALRGSEIPRLNLGLLLFKLRRFQLALQAYRQILEVAEDSGAAWNGVGVVLMELGKASDARAAFTRAVESDPRSADAHYNLSFALSTLGDYDAALREVGKAQSLDPYYVPQKFRLAIELQYEDPVIGVVPDISTEVTADLAAQRPEPGEDAVERMVQELDQPRPRRISASVGDPFALARDYLAKGLFELSVAEVTRALSRGAPAAEGHVLAGDVFARRNSPGDALERYRAARSLEPDRVDARLGEIRALLALGRGAEASDDAEGLARERADDCDVMLAAAEIRLQRGDPAAALKALESARTRAPHRADILKLQGDIAMRLKDLETAREAYEAAAALDPRFVQVRFELGRVYEARHDDVTAERCYREALEALPTYHDAALALASLHRRHGKARAAVNLLVELLATDPNDIETLVGLGHALLDDGRREESLGVFQRALTAHPLHAGAHFFAGVVYARLQRYREAAAEWEQVIRLDPGGAFAQEARRHMRTAQDLQRIFRTEAA
ncbi:MAG: tetratricopeptide repeat protein [Gemmatimonadetes bacterium]|nr:tetratricopeptide repeat protein [Gemmatimonadota bacterium]